MRNRNSDVKRSEVTTRLHRQIMLTIAWMTAQITAGVTFIFLIGGWSGAVVGAVWIVVALTLVRAIHHYLWAFHYASQTDVFNWFQQERKRLEHNARWN